MKHIKHIVNGIIWTVAGLYIILIILLHIPTVQGFIGNEVSDALAKKLGTKVAIGRVDLGFLNRLIIDDVSIQDQTGGMMLEAKRISAKFDILPLTQGRIQISSTQLFGLKAFLYQQTAQSKPNFQFVLDSLASKDTTHHQRLDIHISSLIIRHGEIAYDKRYLPATPHQFSLNHLHAKEISGHFIINAINDDSIHVNIKELSFAEQSGLDIQSLKFKLIATKTGASLQHFELRMPHTALSLGDLHASYRFMGKDFLPATLQFDGSLNPSQITPSDFGCFLPVLSQLNDALSMSTSFIGTSTSLRIKSLKISSHDKHILLNADGSVSDWSARLRWYANIRQLKVSDSGIQSLAEQLGHHLQIPAVLTRLGDIHFRGLVGGVSQDLALKGILDTDAGKVNLAVGRHGHQFTGRIETAHLNLKRILADNRFGTLATRINIDGELPKNRQLKDATITAQGNVSQFTYNSYNYRNLTIDGIYHRGTFDGKLGLDDPNGKITINGHIGMTGVPSARLTAEVQQLNLSNLNITNRWPRTLFSFGLTADISGNNLNTLVGNIDLTGFTMKSPNQDYFLSTMHVQAGNHPDGHYLTMNSDFGELSIQGKFDYRTIAQSVVNLIGSKLPTLPNLPKITRYNTNDFAIHTTINRTDWLRNLFHIPLEMNEPLHIAGTMDDRTNDMNMRVEMPAFTYDGKSFRNGYLHFMTINDSLKVKARLTTGQEGSKGIDWNVSAAAAHNHLNTILDFNNHQKRQIKGRFDTDTQFFTNEQGLSAAHVNVHPSEIWIGDTIWNVNPSDIIYSKNRLTIDHFAIEHNKQHIIVSGLATKNPNDSVCVDLQDVDVSYILNLVDFHAVDFSGLASGRAYISGAFQNPEAFARLTVNQFKFEDGRMGVLSAFVNLNNKDGQIDIDAIANDGPGVQTMIKGYVSPRRNYMDLGIDAHHTNAEFLKGFMGSFMGDVDMQVDGSLHVLGDLSHINLVGQMVSNGKVRILPTNTVYTLKNDTITMVPDEVQFRSDSIYDKDGHLGILNGNLYHQHLTHLSYDLNIKAHNLLSYDFQDFGDDTFCGTAYCTGTCTIKGKSGEVNIDVDVTPEKNSIIVYNAASPNAISENDFIHWEVDKDANGAYQLVPGIIRQKEDSLDLDEPDIPTDIHLNLLVNCNPNATLKVMMDNESGDYIALNGNGVLRATYYNKGAFDMFGNYTVDHGIYKLTIQNVIKKDFQFLEGGTIAFGGDPTHATLNLKAQYPVNGVSLSDLNIGRSFSNNNIRVNCLMNITGTPNSPKVDFGLDLPTVNGDAKQMIYSLINSEEEMNQQVLYLLAIGRFYNQGSNNASAETSEQQSQTSLAMQSLLSGTISQQINNVLSSVTNNSNWNFGANISTGNEGFNNAEYEGLLSGRLLNNRLLINGQFGYRDNANATSSFIGDFDVRYLLLPNGNLAIKVYNQTNDRYFTKNSMNTQGIGLIMKKDFNGWRDFLGKKKKSKNSKSVKKQ